MKEYTIMVVSTGRADYGLLYPLIKKILESERFDLQLVATGTHLSPLHGKTIRLIENDGLKVTDTVEMTMKGDSEDAICSSISLGLLGFSKLFARYDPDLIVVLGDRYELWAICIAAVIHKIPIAHIHGGESTHGLIDDPIRHSVTKMSTFHFPSIEPYAKRIIQLGEDPKRVFVVGALGIDNIKNTPLMNRKELLEYTGVNFDQDIALMTYHPVTLESYHSAEQQIQEVLNALTKTELLTLVTMPNADTAWNQIYKKITHYIQLYPRKFKIMENLGQRVYLSTIKYARLMIGNSSSGIIESASFKLPVVNIGDRQAGRIRPRNVIDCKCSEESILDTINKALSSEFNDSLSNLENPYGDGNTAIRIMKVLESIDFNDKSKLLKKGFYDLNSPLSKIKLERVI